MHILFLILVSIELHFNMDQRFIDSGSDSWAHFMEWANLLLWPSYDGEMWSDLF